MYHCSSSSSSASRKIEKSKKSETNGISLPSRGSRFGSEHVDALDDEDVRPVDDDRFARHDVVGEVRIDRRGDIVLAGLDRRQEADERRAVVALGKALAVHDALPDQLGVRVQKAVGRDELDLRRVGPARQQRLQHARGRRLADRHRAGDADDIGHLAVGGAEEALRRLEQPLRRRDIEREQARQRQIDRDDLVERDRIVGRLQLAQIVDRQRQLRVGAQLRPFVAREAAERRFERGVGRLAIHGDPLGIPSQPLSPCATPFPRWPLCRVRPSSSP